MRPFKMLLLYHYLIVQKNIILQKKPTDRFLVPLTTHACVSYPFAMLLGSNSQVNITYVGNSYFINCTACKLTNCIDSVVAKQYPVMILVKRPPYVMLPVDLQQDPWYENTALHTLETLNALLRPKRFVAALILGITALIAIMTSFAVSTTALVKEMHTAHFVNDMNRNISVALSKQAIIDKKLESKINALKEVVLALGQDITNIKTRMETRCHASYHYICVTPLPYNASHQWEKVKNHLQGVWKDTDITHNLDDLQKDIAAMSKAHLDNDKLEALAAGLKSGFKALNPMDWTQYFILIGVVLFLLVMVVLLFPYLFRLVLKSIHTVKRDLTELRLKNKKPGTAASTCVSTTPTPVSLV